MPLTLPVIGSAPSKQLSKRKNGIHLTASDFLLIKLPPVSSSSSDEKLAETKRLNPVT